MKHLLRNKQINSQSGIYLILVAVLTLLFLSFIALAIGLGFIASQKTRLQTIANISSIAALNAFLNSESTIIQDKEQEATDVANYFITNNKLLSANSNLGGISKTGNENGKITFGRYYPEKPSASAPCGGDKNLDYPCFKEISSGSSVGSNAIIIDIKNAPTNPLYAPLGYLLGQEKFFIEAKAATAVIETCSAFALDVSSSLTENTHSRYPAACYHTPCSPPWECLKSSSYNNCSGISDNYDPDVYIQPSYPRIQIASKEFFTGSMFALSKDKALPTGDSSKCNDTGWSTDLKPEIVYWCNMPDNRTNWELSYGSAPPNMHFKSDYELQLVAMGNMEVLINKFDRPEPMSSFFLGFNTALRKILKLPSEANKAALLAFTGDVSLDINGVELPRVYPPKLNKDYQVTSNIEFMTQLTNMDKIGGVTGDNDPITSAGVADGSQEHPNLLDYGFFSLPSPIGPTNIFYSTSNIVKGLYDAAAALAGPNNNCSPTSKKMIFLATDGVSTCSFSDGRIIPGVIKNECYLEGEDDEILWQGYQEYEYELLAALLPILKAQKIAVNVFFDGAKVLKSYKNIINPDKIDPNTGTSSCQNSNTDGDCFLDLLTAPSYGFIGVNPPNNFGGQLSNCGANSFFNCESQDSFGSNDRRIAYLDVVRGVPGGMFGRAQAVLAQLAWQTGGLFCPLFDINRSDVTEYWDHDGDCPSAGYSDEQTCCLAIFDGDPTASSLTPCKLKNTVRASSSSMSKALEFIPKSLQAAICAERALGNNPYILIKPKKCVPTELCDNL